jgi:tellurite resistance protein TerC
VLRGIFIFIGAAGLRHFRWVRYVFGVILLWAAWKTFRENPAEEKENRAVQWLFKHMRVTPFIRGNRFFVREQGKSVATPLFVAVVGLELTDVMFAFDSVPAAFSVTREEFLVYSSNAFAILGLRALYIVLA